MDVPTITSRCVVPAGADVLSQGASPAARAPARVPSAPPTFANRSLRSRLRFASLAKVVHLSAEREGGPPPLRFARRVLLLLESTVGQGWPVPGAVLATDAGMLRRLDLGALRAAGSQLSATEGAAIALAVCRHIEAAELNYRARTVALADVSIHEDGVVTIAVQLRAPIARALNVFADFLEELLPLLQDAAPGLQLLVPRARGTHGLPSFTSSDEVARAIQRTFDLRDTRTMLQRLVGRVTADLSRHDGIAPVPPLESRRSAMQPPASRLLRAGVALVLLNVGLVFVTLSEFHPQSSTRQSLTRRRVATSNGQPAGRSQTRDAAGHKTLAELPRPFDQPPAVSTRKAVGRTHPSATPPGARASRLPAREPPAVQSTAQRALGSNSPQRIETPGLEGPVFSPSFGDGSALFFHAGRDPAQLVEASLTRKGELLQLSAIRSEGARNYHVRLSPDGQRVAFDSDRDGERGVYIAQRDGSKAVRVSGVGFAAVPSWSPDITRLAFVRGEPGRPRVWNVWLRHLASGTLERLTSHRYGQAWGASWFPDARRICYSHEDRLVILNLETKQRREFASPRLGRLVRTPAVSPDGTRVVFQGTSRRRLVARPAERVYAQIARGRNRRGVHVGPGGPTGRLSQPPRRRVAYLDVGADAVDLAGQDRPGRRVVAAGTLRVFLNVRTCAATDGQVALSDVTDAPVAGCSQFAPNVCATD